MKQQYDSYKPSGIDWIGDIPSHWSVMPVKHILDNLDYLRQPISAEDRERNNPKYDYYGASGVIDQIDFYNVDDTVLLIGEDGANLVMRNLPLIYRASGKFWVNNHAHILKPKNGHNYSYLAHLLEAGDYTLFITGSAQPKLSQENLNKYPICIPPLAEQEAIAAWLDEKCEEIDAAIAKVDREIELIDELKQSEISRVVTRGLDPDAPLRPSGIDWIGDIPAHWTKSRIKNHVSRSAAGVWGDDEKGNKNDIICFRIADFNYGERCLSFDKITIRNIDPKQLEGRYLSKGDLLIEKSGGGETTPVGRVVYCNYDGKATYTNFIHSISLSDNVDSRFFLYYFNMLYSNKINLLYFNQTTGLQNLQIGEYLGQPIYLPPLSEQQTIADYLDKKCAEIDGLKAKLTKKRETLTELRQSIISEVARHITMNFRRTSKRLKSAWQRLLFCVLTS